MSHKCNNCVVTCIDFRFRPLLRPFFDALGECDRVSLAGSSKAVVDTDTRDTVLKQIMISHKLHGISTVIFVDHEDCGAYGGKGAVKSDSEETALHTKTLNQARDIIKQTFPNLKVILKYIQLNGIVIDL